MRGQPNFANIIEEERDHRYCKLHIQTWVYIHSGVSIVLALLGISVGVLFIVFPHWHESFNIYKLYFAYRRRNDAAFYWIVYKVVFGTWIFLHVLHIASIVSTIFGIHLTRSRLIIPQLCVLLFHIGIFIFSINCLCVISITGARTTWLSLLIISFFTIFACSNLVMLVVLYRFLYEKNEALKAILANKKGVKFKDKVHS